MVTSPGIGIYMTSCSYTGYLFQQFEHSQYGYWRGSIGFEMQGWQPEQYQRQYFQYKDGGIPGMDSGMGPRDFCWTTMIITVRRG